MSGELELIRPLTWPEVFAIWEQNEASNPKWIALSKERGFASWQEWRMSYANPLKLPDREWVLYKVTNPQESVPQWHGGPFRSWVELYYQGKQSIPFAELVQSPAVAAKPEVIELLENFPSETTITGLMQDTRIVIIEGMHRCCALAKAAAENKSITTTLYIALADATGEVLPTVGGWVK